MIRPILLLLQFPRMTMGTLQYLSICRYIIYSSIFLPDSHLCLLDTFIVIIIQPKNRKDFLLEYVNNVQPEFLEVFTKRAPKHVFQNPNTIGLIFHSFTLLFSMLDLCRWLMQCVRP